MLDRDITKLNKEQLRGIPSRALESEFRSIENLWRRFPEIRDRWGTNASPSSGLRTEMISFPPSSSVRCLKVELPKNERSIIPVLPTGPGLVPYAIDDCAFSALLDIFFQDPKQSHGISLIPNQAEWPQSSLAQMIAWIQQEYPMSYGLPDKLPDNSSRLGLRHRLSLCIPVRPRV